ncbi:MAG: NAD(P)/FAD-dependent oxidoreductase [Firmicutes bacterium]|nr:NAD(P)/FAD-dependent oxidoreductase [Bacillota bacterium]
MRNTQDVIYDMLIIGGGAAGLMLAAGMTPLVDYRPEDGSPSAGKSNCFRGLILEKTSRPGTKLLMTGGGRCNITHAGTMKELLPAYGESGRALRSILYKYGNLDLLRFLEQQGVRTSTEEDGRVFPASNQAEEIRQIFLRQAVANGFTIRTNAEVTGLSQAGDIWEITAQENTARKSAAQEKPSPASQQNSVPNRYRARHVVIACGGASYPQTGSDGSFFLILEEALGISLVPRKPALTPMRVSDYPYGELSGISIPHVRITAIPQAPTGTDSQALGKIDVTTQATDKAARSRDEKKRSIPASEGALLFARQELTGPAVLNLSASLSPGDEIRISYLPGHSAEELLGALKVAAQGSRSELLALLLQRSALPRRFLQTVLARLGLQGKKASEVSNKEFTALASLLTGETFTVREIAGYSRAMLTRGGIPLAAFDPRTMALKEHPGLYAIGEAVDADGPTGGYNLQLCWSEARACGADISAKTGFPD